MIEYHQLKWIIVLENICQCLKHYKKRGRPDVTSGGNTPHHLWSGLAQNIVWEWPSL